MDFRTTEQEEAFRQQVRNFMDAEFPPEFLRELEAEPAEERRLYRECIRRLASRGWLGIGWPKEYGGQQRSYAEQLIYYLELNMRLPWKVINPVGIATALAAPTIMAFGSGELKKDFLPRILKGEATFCLGYSEPAAGSDLVGIQTVAVADGDEYIVNGQKCFINVADYADYCWLSAKTDPEATRRSQGISLLIADMKSPGVTVRGVPTMSRLTVNDIIFHDVRVPKKHRVGEENQGWHYITQALNHERLGFGVLVAVLKHAFDELMGHAREARGKGQPLGEDPAVRYKLAQLAIELEVARLLAARLVWMLEKGVVPHQESSMAKIFVTELEQRLANAGMQILGPYGQLKEGSKWAALKGRMEDAYRYSVLGTIGGGSNEVQRMIIAIAGLGLPRG